MWPKLLKLGLPTSLASVLVDQLICSHAAALLLNGFSTFSSLILRHIGLRYPVALGGWDAGNDIVDERRIAAFRNVGVHVRFWTRVGNAAPPPSPALPPEGSVPLALPAAVVELEGSAELAKPRQAQGDVVAHKTPARQSMQGFNCMGVSVECT